MSEYAYEYSADDVLDEQEMILSALPQIEKIAGRMASGYGSTFVSADDLVQEGYLALDRAIGKYNPQMGSFAAFAGVVVQNAMANVICKERKRYNLSADTMAIQLVDDPEEVKSRWASFMCNEYNMTPEQIVIRKETFEEIHRALDMVPLRDKAYLWYRFGFDGEDERSMSRTAEHFHLSERAGKRTEKEALKKVGQMMRGNM